MTKNHPDNDALLVSDQSVETLSEAFNDLRQMVYETNEFLHSSLLF